MTELKRQIEQAIGAALLKPGGVDLPDIADTVLAVLREQQPVAWGAFHFGGKHHGKLFSHCEMREHIESYILDRHQSDDVNTFRSGPLYAAPMPPRAPDFHLLRECGFINDRFKDFEALGIVADDDPNYDYFAGGFKAAVGIVESFYKTDDAT